MKAQVKNSRLFPIFCLLCICITISGCKKMGVKKRLRIDLDVYYKHNFVQLKLDGVLVFSDTISTDYTISLAESLVLNYPIGRCKLSVSVDGNERKLKFWHKAKGTFIAISYAAPDIIVRFPAKEYYYD